MAATPSEVAQSYLDAVDRGDSARVADLVEGGVSTRIGKSILTVVKTAKNDVTRDLFLDDVFGKSPSAEEIASMSPVQAFARYITRNEGTDSEEDSPDKMRIKTKLIGSVQEGEEFTHVLFRHRIAGGAPLTGAVPQDFQPEPEIVTLHKVEASWKVVIPAKELSTYLQYVRDHFERESKLQKNE
jgi:hypothetical protein